MKQKLLTVLLILGISAATGLAGSYHSESRLPISPDESQALFFSKQLSSTGSLVYKNDYNERYDSKIFASRQYVQNGNDTVPSAFLGYIIMLFMFRCVGDGYIYLLTPVLVAVCLTYLYLLSKRLFNHKAGMIAIILLGTTSSFIYWAASFYNNIAELTFLIVGIYYLVKAMDTRNLADYLMVAVAMGGAVWLRYTNLLLIPVFVALYLFMSRKKIVYKYIMCAGLVGAVILAPVFVMNKTLYGSPLKFGQNSPNQLVYPYIEPGVPKEKLPFVPFRSVNILLKSSKTYIVAYSPLLFTLAVLGIVYTYKNKHDHRAIVTALLSLVAVWVLYYLGGYYFGYGDEPILSASYTRYLLIVYAIFVLFAAYYIAKLRNKYLMIGIVVFMSVIAINNSITSQRGLIALYDQMDGAHRYLVQIADVVPEDGVVFVKGSDKIIFPYRQTALYQMQAQDAPESLAVERTTSLMSQLLANKHRVFILEEDNYKVGYPVSVYLDGLKANDLEITNHNRDLDLYEIGDRR